MGQGKTGRRRQRRGGRRGIRTARMERIGAERIEILVREAISRALSGDHIFPIRYMERARKIAMRLNLKTLRDHRDEFCKSCLSPFVDSTHFRVRLRGGRKITTCLRCGAVMRRPYNRERPAARRRERYNERR